MIEWAYFPRNAKPSAFTRSVVTVFEAVATDIDSQANNGQIAIGYKDATSDRVLATVRPGLQELGFIVETSKSADGLIRVPVLYGRGGLATKSFHADAYCPTEKFVLEVEAGRAVTNYQFLKDLFEACVMDDVDFLGLAVRKVYKTSADFDKVYDFFDTLYTSGRLRLPLKGILLVGY